MRTRKDICDKAREYLDTPYVNQGRLKGIGIDCAGLIVEICKELNCYNGGDYEGYSMTPDGHKLFKTCQEYAGKEKDIEDMEAGDILLMRFASNPQHLGILLEDGYIAHAYLRARKVVIHRIDKEWKDRIVSVFNFPE